MRKQNCGEEQQRRASGIGKINGSLRRKQLSNVGEDGGRLDAKQSHSSFYPSFIKAFVLRKSYVI